MFDQFQNGYYSTGEKIATAWNVGAGLMRKNNRTKEVSLKHAAGHT